MNLLHPADQMMKESIRLFWHMSFSQEYLQQRKDSIGFVCFCSRGQVNLKIIKDQYHLLDAEPLVVEVEREGQPTCKSLK